MNKDTIALLSTAALCGIAVLGLDHVYNINKYAIMFAMLIIGVFAGIVIEQHIMRVLLKGPFDVFRRAPNGEVTRIAAHIPYAYRAIRKARREKARHQSDTYEVWDRTGTMVFKA